MRLLPAFLCSASLAAGAAVPVDAVIHWEGSAQGALNATKLTTGTVGTYDGWAAYSGSRFTMVSAGSGVFPVSVTCAGDTFTGAGTNWIKNNTGAGGADESIEFKLPGYAESVITNAAICGFITIAVTNNTPQILLDLILMEGSYGDFSVFQLSAENNAIEVRAHSSSGGSSTYGAAISLTNEKTYYYQLFRKPLAGKTYVRVYDPANSFTMVGSSEANSDNANTYHLLFKSGYIGDPPDNALFGDQVVLYSPTDQTLTNLVTVAAGVTSTMSVGTLRAGTATWK